jgi:VanZ family protein
MSHSGLPDRSTASVLRGWHLAAIGAFLAVLLQLWGLYRALGPAQPSWFRFADKLQHVVGFALPVLLILLTIALRGRFGWQGPGRGTSILVAAIFAAHAIVSEVIQHVWYRYRTGELLDVVADWLGIAVGIVVFRLIYLRRSRAVESLVTS